MKILAIGDVVGECGCRFLLKTLKKIKAEKQIDFCIVNGENSAVGNGITPDSAQLIFAAGADVITTGNHVFRRKGVYDYLDENKFIVRPENLKTQPYGRGYITVDMGKDSVTVINLMGNAYDDTIENPFDVIDRVLSDVGENKNIIVDFHAESTGEKKAMAFYLDGRVSVLYGTHTHVQTSDETIMPHGTGYITDLGMTGAEISCLGVKSECIIEKLKNGSPVKFEQESGPAVLCGCIFTVDHGGHTVETERILVREKRK